MTRSTLISLRCPDPLLETVEALVAASGRSRTDVIVELLQRSLAQGEIDQAAGLSPFECETAASHAAANHPPSNRRLFFG